MFPPRYNGETGTQKQLCGILFLSLNSLTVSLIVAVELNRRYMWMSGFCMDCRLHPIVGDHVPIRGGRVEALLQSDPPGENRSWARWTLCWPGSLHCCWRIGWSLNIMSTVHYPISLKVFQMVENPVEMERRVWYDSEMFWDFHSAQRQHQRWCYNTCFKWLL